MRVLVVEDAIAVPLVAGLEREGFRVTGAAALELGADDYLVKSCGFRELVAGIGAATRRTSEPDAGRPQQIGELGIDRRARRVRVAGALTEFDLLACLAEGSRTVIPRQEVLDEIWDPHWYRPSRTIDVHAASIRKKLGDARWVETVRGVGYRMGVVE